MSSKAKQKYITLSPKGHMPIPEKVWQPIHDHWELLEYYHRLSLLGYAEISRGPELQEHRFAWHRPNGNPVTQFQIPKSIKLMCFKPKLYFHSYRSGQETEGHNSAFTRLERSRDKLSIDSQLQLIFPCRNVYTPNFGVLKCFLKDFLRKIKWFCKNFSF